MCKTCIVCRKPLNNGIIVYGQGICENCEKRLLVIDRETDFYDFYKNCIRKNLVQLIPRGVNDKCRDYR